MDEEEENPFEQEEDSPEEFKSEIPFEEFNEENVSERKDTNVNRLMEKFDSITDAAEAEISEEEDDDKDDFLEADDGDKAAVDSDEENLEEAIDIEVDDQDDVSEPSMDFEDPFAEPDVNDGEEKEGAQKKTSEIVSDEEKSSGSILSSLDSVFSKMDEDAKAQVEKVEVKGKTALVTDENGNTTPIKVTPKIRRKAYKISTDLLTEYEENAYWEIDDETRHAASSLMATLKEFNIEANVTEIRKGPVVTMFEMLPAPGVRLSKIQALQDNIALRLAAKSVRIVAPIPGKRAVGIEVPNKNRAIVSFRECIEQNRPEWKKMAVPVVLGKDIEGETQLMDLVKTPHLLIAGSTGAGKSVCVNSMILSILFKRSPNEVKLILIDPKIVELSLYNGIGHLLTPVITEPKMAMQALQYCLCEMERRYAVLKSLGCRDIVGYNQKIQEQHLATEKLPYIVVVIDEFADLMATTGKQLEQSVARLAAKARAIGIHLVLATQRPSVDVITGLIKANIPSRIAFMVSSKMDSRIIIDQMGADKLLGKGDMLYASSTDPFPVRIQGAFVSDQEVENVVNEVKNVWGEPEYIDEEIFVDDEEDGSDGQMSLFGDGEDPLYEKALDIVIQAGKASASYIQRRLSIGYNRAARLVEEMEERGIVGPANGSKPREIIHMP
ncbi:MAG: DNA translocase FtsK [Treponema sp.]|nr:DNA translocase FtsK [Treponema sp.]